MINEEFKILMRGMYKDIIRKVDPNKIIIDDDKLNFDNAVLKTVEETEWKDNKIVQANRLLMASLYSGKTGYNNNINFHAIGFGNALWDSDPPPPIPNFTDTQLTAEMFRTAPWMIYNVDDDGNMTSELTYKIEIKTIFYFGEEWVTIFEGIYGSFVVREQGLFGGSASSAANSGQMIDVIRHLPISLDAETQLERRIRIEFSVEES